MSAAGKHSPCRGRLARHGACGRSRAPAPRALAWTQRGHRARCRGQRVPGAARQVRGASLVQGGDLGPDRRLRGRRLRFTPMTHPSPVRALLAALLPLTTLAAQQPSNWTTIALARGRLRPTRSAPRRPSAPRAKSGSSPASPSSGPRSRCRRRPRSSRRTTMSSCATATPSTASPRTSASSTPSPRSARPWLSWFGELVLGHARRRRLARLRVRRLQRRLAERADRHRGAADGRQPIDRGDRRRRHGLWPQCPLRPVGADAEFGRHDPQCARRGRDRHGPRCCGGHLPRLLDAAEHLDHGDAAGGASRPRSDNRDNIEQRANLGRVGPDRHVDQLRRAGPDRRGLDLGGCGGVPRRRSRRVLRFGAGQLRDPAGGGADLLARLPLHLRAGRRAAGRRSLRSPTPSARR